MKPYSNTVTAKPAEEKSMRGGESGGHLPSFIQIPHKSIITVQIHRSRLGTQILPNPIQPRISLVTQGRKQFVFVVCDWDTGGKQELGQTEERFFRFGCLAFQPPKTLPETIPSLLHSRQNEARTKRNQSQDQSQMQSALRGHKYVSNTREARPFQAAGRGGVAEAGYMWTEAV